MKTEIDIESNNLLLGNADVKILSLNLLIIKKVLFAH